MFGLQSENTEPFDQLWEFHYVLNIRKSEFRFHTDVRFSSNPSTSFSRSTAKSLVISSLFQTWKSRLYPFSRSSPAPPVRVASQLVSLPETLASLVFWAAFSALSKADASAVLWSVLSKTSVLSVCSSERKGCCRGWSHLDSPQLPQVTWSSALAFLRDVALWFVYLFKVRHSWFS